MSQEALVAVLTEARALLARPDNDFFYSRWQDGAEACADIDRFLTAIGQGGTIWLPDIELLFAPTGSIQEVSLSSGWGDAFLHLSQRFDEAIHDL